MEKALLGSLPGQKIFFIEMGTRMEPCTSSAEPLYVKPPNLQLISFHCFLAGTIYIGVLLATLEESWPTPR